MGVLTCVMRRRLGLKRSLEYDLVDTRTACGFAIFVLEESRMYDIQAGSLELP